MTSLQDNNVTKISEDEELARMNCAALEPQMSIATRRYAGKKGYLDENDKMIRKYDKDGDGHFSIEEAKAMAADFRSALMSKEMYHKMLITMGVLLVISWAGNFGLTFATVALTKQLETQGGDLTDTAGNIVATKPKGVSGEFFPEYSSENPADLRRLQVGNLFLIGTHEKTRALMLTAWTDHSNNVPLSTNFDLDGVNHSSNVNLGTQELGVADENDATATCDVYGGIQVDADPTSIFTLKCCGAGTQMCDVFTQVTQGRRRQEEVRVKPCACCFSPMSTVIEQTKGKMFLKDLKFGDSVLAANQVFQPYVLDAHSHPSKPTEFIQIHTELSDNDPKTAPIELTSEHMIFIEGKDLPILSRDVEVDDSLLGTSSPTKVTKINTVMRDGLSDPLTADATLYVDGILASSVADARRDGNLNFGPFKIHFHTFMSRVAAPLVHSLCAKVDSKHCETRVDDGNGGTMNILMKAGDIIIEQNPFVQGLGLALLVAAGAISLFCYYAFMRLALIALVTGVFVALAKVKEQSTKTKNKVA